MERWVEHYSELYLRVNVVSEEALMAMESLPIMDELDSKPTLEDINQALDQLSSVKAQCWREGEVPQDMRDANIVTLYKNKGDRGDCNNYHGISLLNIVGKLFAKVVLMKLWVLAEGKKGNH